jgi:hypothetical protein
MMCIIYSHIYYTYEMNEEFYMYVNSAVFNCNSFRPFDVSRLTKKRLFTVNITSLILILIRHINKAIYLNQT